MRRMVAGVCVALVLLLVRGPAVAFAVDVVTVEAGPTEVALLIPPCNDVALFVEQQRSFVLRRQAALDAPLTVLYSLSGSAQAGVHYDPLPGSASFAPGAASATVDVVPRPVAGGAIVELTMHVEGASATIRFVSPPLPMPECGYRFTADPWNTAQMVAIGQPLHRLTLEELRPPSLLPATGRFRVVSGTLPPGVALRDDGSFAGAPLFPGTFTAGIEACRPEPPGTCVRTDLTVTVQWQAVDVVTAIPALIGGVLGVGLTGLGQLLAQLFGAFIA